jgi:hypothetical protein
MEKESRAMCQACGRKVATRHIYQPGAEPPRMSLCSDCVETHAPDLVRELIEDLKAGRCRFCGGQAAVTDGLVRIIDGPGADHKFLCQSCSSEYYKIGSRYFDSPEDLVESKSDERLREIIAKIDMDMRRWVSQRDN